MLAEELERTVQFPLLPLARTVIRIAIQVQNNGNPSLGEAENTGETKLQGVGRLSTSSDKRGDTGFNEEKMPGTDHAGHGSVPEIY
jgi:hypothetical protein